MKTTLRDWAIGLLLVYLGYRGIVFLTDYVRVQYPEGWWHYAHMVALTVCWQLLGHLRQIEQRFGINRWISIGLAATAVGAWIIYPFLRWGL